MPTDYPIPTTDALQRVSRHSLQDLFSRDPEEYTKADLDDIIYALRDLRDRLESSDGKVRQARVAAPAPKGVGNPEELGI